MFQVDTELFRETKLQGSNNLMVQASYFNTKLNTAMR